LNQKPAKSLCPAYAKIEKGKTIKKIQEKMIVKAVIA
jgi:hypothetical protein